MIIERDSHRREREELYRKQLLNEINEKNKIKNRSRIVAEEPKQSFSLIKNIQVEQEKRKNKYRQYYADLQQQRQQELRRKKQEKLKKQEREREEQRKLQLQNAEIKRRFEEEKKKENQKKTLQQIEPEQYIPDRKRDSPKKQNHFPDQIDILKSKSEQVLQQPYKPEKIESLYGNRIENQHFNFVPQRKFPENYYKELLYEGKKFEESINGISQLNKMLNREKLKPKKRSGRGIQDLRQLDKMLEEQSKKYMNNAYQDKLLSISYPAKRSKTYHPYSQNVQGSNYDYYERY